MIQIAGDGQNGTTPFGLNGIGNPFAGLSWSLTAPQPAVTGVLMTACDNAAAAVLAAGADALLPKPFDVADLLALVRRLEAHAGLSFSIEG